MLSSKAKYAVRAAIRLAERPSTEDWVQTAEVAAQERIPRKFLEAILVQLRDHGIVESRRGAHGGHRLMRDPRGDLGGRHHSYRGRATGVDTVRQRDAISPVRGLRGHEVLSSTTVDARDPRCGRRCAGESLAGKHGERGFETEAPNSGGGTQARGKAGCLNRRG